MTTRTILIIAFAVGALISGTLVALEKPTNFAFINWELPGHAAAFVFWGTTSDSVAMGMTIAWFVNAIVYSVPAFFVLSMFKALKRAASRGADLEG